MLSLTVFVTVNGSCAIQFCQACTSDGVHCETCEDLWRFGITDSSGGIIECLLSCPSGTYADSSYKCQSCMSGCRFCTSGTTCVTCQPTSPYWIMDSSGSITQCLVHCPDQYTSATGTHQCVPCQSKYNGCDGAADKCVRYASEHNELYDSSSSTSFSDCVKECPDHYYSEDNKCYPCMNGCDKCSDGNSCDTCSPEQPFMVKDDNGKTTQCLSECPDQYTLEEGSQMCIKCGEKCDGCNGAADKCVKCASTHLPLFDSEETKVLQDCIAGCVDGQYKKGSACYPCDSKCKTCNSEASKCTVCADGFKNVFSDSGATVIGNCIEEAEVCPDGTFESEGNTPSCIPCTPHHNCLLCTNAASCSACGTGEFSIPVFSSVDTSVFVCASSCDGYFTTEKTPRCIGCDPALNCAVCHSVNVSGVDPFYKIVEHGTMLSQIEKLSGFFNKAHIVFNTSNPNIVFGSNTSVETNMDINVSQVSRQEIIVVIDGITNVSVDDIKDAITGVIVVPDGEHVWVDVVSEGDGSFHISVIKTDGVTDSVSDSLKECLNQES